MKVLILYYSVSGNTMELAEFISDLLKKEKYEVTLADTEESLYFNPLNFDHLIMGTCTWSQGKVPVEFKEYIRELEIKDVYIFGTGDKQFGQHYNLAAINLSKYYNSPYEPLLVEQTIEYMNQKEKVKKWTEGMINKWKN